MQKSLNINQNQRILILVGFLIFLIVLLWMSNLARLHYKIVVVETQDVLKLTAFSLIFSIVVSSLLYIFIKPLLPSLPSQQYNKLLMQLRLIIFFLVFFLIGWWGVATTFNALMDKKPIHVYRVRVIEKQTRHFRFFTDYELILKSWIANEDQREINLTHNEYDSLDVKTGDEVEVSVGSGALGIRWIASIKKAE